MDPPVIHVNECGGNNKKFVSLRPHLPIRIKNFTFEVGYNGEENVVGDICVRGKLSVNTNPEKCLAKLTEWHKPYHPLWIRLTAICQKIEQIQSNLSSVVVKFHTNFHDPHNNWFWTSYNFPPIKVKLTTSSIYLY